MNKPTSPNPRVYDLARANKVATKFILRVLNLTQPNKYSASSRVELSVDTQMFWETVIELALLNQDRDTELISNLSQN